MKTGYLALLIYPIIMSIGKILWYIRDYSIHISQKTFNFAA